MRTSIITLLLFFFSLSMIFSLEEKNNENSTQMIACPCQVDFGAVTSEYYFTEYSIINRLNDLRNNVIHSQFVIEGDTLVQLFLDYDMQEDTLIIFKNCFEWNGSIYSKDSSLYARINPYIPYDCWLKIHKYFE